MSVAWSKSTAGQERIVATHTASEITCSGSACTYRRRNCRPCRDESIWDAGRWDSGRQWRLRIIVRHHTEESRRGVSYFSSLPSVWEGPLKDVSIVCRNEKEASAPSSTEEMKRFVLREWDFRAQYELYCGSRASHGQARVVWMTDHYRCGAVGFRLPSANLEALFRSLLD
jgi:hypothetical protein